MIDSLAAGLYDLRLSLPGYQSVELLDVPVGVGQTVDLGNIDLSLGATITGSVASVVTGIDPGGVTVGLYQNGAYLDGAVPDASDVFQFVDIAPGDYRIALYDPTEWPGTFMDVTVLPGQTLNDVDLVVAHGATLTGVVTDSVTASPLAGVPVYWTDSDDVTRTTYTDAAGVYHFFGLGLGDHVVTLTLQGATGVATVTVTDIEAGTHAANLSVAGSARINGVTRRDDGTPAPDVTVELRQGNDVIVTTRSDADGVYEFVLTQPGAYTLDARGGGGLAFAEQAVVINAGQTAQQDLLAGPHRLDVTLDDGVAPVTGFVVLIDRADDAIVDTLETDANGAVAFDGLTPGDYLIRAIGDGGLYAAQLVTIIAGDETADVIVSTPRALTGRVLDGMGAAIDGASLTLLTGDDPTTTLSESDGAFDINAAPDGVVEVLVVAPGHEAKIVTFDAVTNDMDITLDDASATIDGRVVDTGGQPILDALIVVADASGNTIGVGRSAADGAFHIDSATGAGLTLTVRATGYSRAELASLDLTAGNVDAGDLVITPVATSRFTGVIDGLGVDPRETPNITDAGWVYASPGAPGWLRSLLSSPQRRVEPTVTTEALGFKPCPAGRAAWANLRAAERRLNAKWELVEFTFDNLAGQRRLALATLPVSFFTALGTLAEIGLAIVPFTAVALPTGALPVALAIVTAAKGAYDAVAQARSASSAKGALQALNETASFSQKVSDQIIQLISLLEAGDVVKVAGKGFARLGGASGFIGKLLDLKETVRTLTFFELRDQLQVIASVEDTYEQAYFQYDQAVDAAYLAEYQYRRVICRNPKKPRPKNPKPDGRYPKKHDPPVVVSKDPNDILGPEGFGPENWVRADQALDFTIRFENDPIFASAPAQEVIITQQLDADLDWRTFRLDDIGFGDFRLDLPGDAAFVSERIDLADTHGYWVDVFAFIDVLTGETTWTITTIDPATGQKPLDPTIGFLPPNDADGIGEGFVSYTVRPDSDAVTGETVDSEARIVFDINEPIDTPAIMHTLDADLPSSAVLALPIAVASNDFLVTWAGDDAGGSGVATYDVYYTDNEEPITPWLTDVTLTNALFSGEQGRRYGFYTVARDNVGYTEKVPLAIDAMTRVAGAQNPPIASDSAFTTDEGVMYEGALDAFDFDADPLLVTLMVAPTRGDLVVHDDATFQYTPYRQPTVGFAATDTFSFIVNDGINDSDTASVTITINPINDPPVSSVDAYMIDEDAGLMVDAAGGVLANDADPGDGDAIIAVIMTEPSNGQLTLNADGSFTYTPDPNYHGNDTFTYVANDGLVDSNETLVEIQIDSVNDLPVTGADTYGTHQHFAIAVDAAGGVLENDSDPVEGDPIDAVLVDAPMHGQLTFNADGSFNYVPDDLFYGADTFTYVANDGTDDSAVTDATILVKQNLDIDGDDDALPLTDGVLMIRQLAGFGGDVLASGALGANARRTDPIDLGTYMADAADVFMDVDGDGHVMPLTDGILVIRYLAGFTDSVLITGATGAGATRDAAAIEAFLAEHMPPIVAAPAEPAIVEDAPSQQPAMMSDDAVFMLDLFDQLEPGGKQHAPDAIKGDLELAAMPTETGMVDLLANLQSLTLA